MHSEGVGARIFRYHLLFVQVTSYKVDSSFVDGEAGLENSPFRLNPGELVELRTYEALVAETMTENDTYHFMNLLLDVFA